MKTKLLAAGLAVFMTFACTDVMVGTVTNSRQDGHVDGLDWEKGDKILTLESYSPANLVDGIVYRKDVKISK